MQRKYAIIQDELGVIALPSPYHRRTIALPGPLHVRVSPAKSEHEAAQVGRWYDDGVEQSRSRLGGMLAPHGAAS